MGEKPIHYDGSIQSNGDSNSGTVPNEPFKLTDEARSMISGNPFEVNK